MSLKADIDVTTSWSSGSNSVTISGFGTVKGALGSFHYDGSDDDTNSSIRDGLWYSDTSTSSIQAFIDRDNRSNTGISRNVGTGGGNNVISYEPSLGSFGSSAYLSISGTTTDGITVNASSNMSSTVASLLLGGDDVTCKLVSKDVSTQNTNYNVTDVGFQPDLILAWFSENQTDTGLQNDNFGDDCASYGLITNYEDSIQQISYTEFRDHGASPAAMASRISDSYGAVATDSTGNLTWAVEFSDFDSDGFTITPKDGAPSSTTRVYCLCLNFNDKHVAKAEIIDTPTSTGNQSYTSPGFKPICQIGYGTALEAVNTTYNTSSELAGQFSMFFVDNDGDEHSAGYYSDQGANPTDTAHFSYNDIRCYDDSGNLSPIATWSSYDTNGYTWNFSSVETNAKKWLVVNISEEQSAAADIYINQVMMV